MFKRWRQARKDKKSKTSIPTQKSTIEPSNVEKLAKGSTDEKVPAGKTATAPCPTESNAASAGTVDAGKGSNDVPGGGAAQLPAQQKQDGKAQGARALFKQKEAALGPKISVPKPGKLPATKAKAAESPNKPGVAPPAAQVQEIQPPAAQVEETQPPAAQIQETREEEPLPLKKKDSDVKLARDLFKERESQLPGVKNLPKLVLPPKKLIEKFAPYPPGFNPDSESGDEEQPQRDADPLLMKMEQQAKLAAQHAHAKDAPSWRRVGQNRLKEHTSKDSLLEHDLPSDRD